MMIKPLKPADTQPLINCRQLCSSIAATLQHLSIRITKCFQQIGKKLFAVLPKPYITLPVILISTYLLGYLLALKVAKIFIENHKLTKEKLYWDTDKRIRNLEEATTQPIITRYQTRKKQLIEIISNLQELTRAISTPKIHDDLLRNKGLEENRVSEAKNRCLELASSIQDLIIQINTCEDRSEMKEGKQRDYVRRIEVVEAKEQPGSHVTTSRKIDPSFENIIEEAETISIDVLKIRGMLAADNPEVVRKIKQLIQEQLKTARTCFLDKANALFR